MKNRIFVTDHKLVGRLYLLGAMTAFAMAGLMALLIRFELSKLGETLPDLLGQGGADNYAVYLSYHGAAMVFAFLIPGLIGFCGSYLTPLMIGASGTAMPRTGMFGLLSLWLAIVLSLFGLAGSLINSDPRIFYLVALLLLCLSALLTAINLVITVIYRRAPGLGWNQLNIFVWAMVCAGATQLIFLPVLIMALLMLLFDIWFGTGFYPLATGEEPDFYRKLFWFYSHPVVYVILLPAVGILFEIISTNVRKPVFNYQTAVFGGMCGIVALGVEVWAHHIYAAGMIAWLQEGMKLTALLTSVPVGLLLVSLVGTLYKGSIRFTVPMLYATADLFLILVGGLTGIPLAMNSMTAPLSDTYFVMAHFHYIMGVMATFSLFGAIYHWFPKITGKMYNKRVATIGFWLNFIGINLTFWPLFYAGIAGMPRRYFDYQMFPELEGAQQLATFGALVVAVAMGLIVTNWIHGAMAGEKAPDNPWNSRSLEWTDTASPPIAENFSVVPKIDAEWTPYKYQERHTPVF